MAKQANLTDRAKTHSRAALQRWVRNGYTVAKRLAARRLKGGA